MSSTDGAFGRAVIINSHPSHVLWAPLPPDPSGLRPGHQHRGLVLLDPQGREDARPVGAGVKANPVRPDLDRLRDRMAMHDDRLMPQLRLQEFPPDPAQVMPGLGIDRNARPQAGKALCPGCRQGAPDALGPA